ncbi:MAG: FAD-dependent oxidoreductase [Proteobacteria bacterium]|nr:FAD-dependent oxidoreductase [Pseudomonadota bacterium]
MSEMQQQWPVVVVGAGAAGLLAALHAARAGVRVLLVETRPKPGAKIRVSGGGRCNVLPSTMSLDDYATSGSRNTLRNILLGWPLAEVRRFFESELGIPMKTEATGKVFPVSEQPLDVVDALLRACARAGVTLTGAFRVTQIVRTNDARGACFDIEASGGRRVRAQRVVLATGGLSLPKTGSDGAGLRFAELLGVATVPTYPALVPLTTSAR